MLHLNLNTLVQGHRLLLQRQIPQAVVPTLLRKQILTQPQLMPLIPQPIPLLILLVRTTLGVSTIELAWDAQLTASNFAISHLHNRHALEQTSPALQVQKKLLIEQLAVQFKDSATLVLMA